MKFSTKLFAIASAMLLTFSANASAAVDLSASPVVPVTFAQELVVSPTDILGAAVNGVTAVTAPLGFSIASGTSKYIRYDLTNATFTVQVAFGEVACGTAFASTTVSTGGALADTFVIFEVEGNALGNNPADVVTLTTAAGFTVSDNSSSVSMQYRLFETAADAVNETNALSNTGAQVFVNFATGVLVTEDTVVIDGAATTAVGVIDVTEASLQFAAITTPTNGGATVFETRIGDVEALVDLTVYSPTTDVLLVAGDIGLFVGATATLTLTGDFTALQNTDGTYTGAALTSVFVDNGDFCASVLATTSTTSLDATTAVISIPSIQIPELSEICFVAQGFNDIGAVTFTADYFSGGALAAPATMTLETLTKNGASDTLNFALKPTTAFTNLVRITNSGTVAGDVFITLITDAGATATFELADVDGVASSELASGASTAYINIAALYAAAQVAEPTFDNDGGQLRVNIDSTCTEIIVNGIAMSKDNNVFTVIDSVDNASN